MKLVKFEPGNLPVPSKLNAAKFHESIKAKIMENGEGLFEYLTFLKFCDKLAEEISGNQYKEGDKEFKEMARKAIEAYGKSYTTPTGVKFELAETGTKYDFSHNPKWVEMKERMDALKVEMKAYEDLLKAVPAGKEIFDGETGDKLIGPGKTSTSSFKVTLPKS
jgi:hypothetical protein